MKNTILVMAVVCICHLAQSQIDVPNGNFETWGVYNNWNYTPDQWSTGNFQLFEHVFIDSLSYEGTKAMMVKPYTFFEPSPGQATIFFEISEIPDVLEFVYKSNIAGELDSVSVHVQVFNDQDLLYNVMWDTDESQLVWTPVSLSLPSIVLPATHMRISVQAGYGIFLGGSFDTWISVDDLRINTSSSVSESEIEAHVNFTAAFVSWENLASEKVSGNVYDLTGKELLNGHENKINLTTLSQGIYLFVLRNENGTVLLSRCFYR
ncbi:MAG: T9SS type A sorting domain-containing protein [Bacteroidota bacterium]